MNQEIWDSGTGVGKWNWRYADGAGASASTKMTLNKTGELDVTTSVTAPSFVGALTGNATSATSATSASLLQNNGSLTTQGGNGAVNYVYAINNSTTGLFPGSDNSNSLLTLSRHPGNYYSQLGFSSNGNLYYRKFSNTAINTTQSWNQIMLSGQGPQGTITGGGQNLRLALWDGNSSIGSDADFTYNSDTIFTTKLEASTSVTINSSATNGEPVLNFQQAGTQKASLQFIDGTNTTTDPDKLVLTSVPSSFTINTNSADRIRIDTVGQARIGIGGKKTSIGSDVTPTTILTVFDHQDSTSYSGIAIKQYNNPYDNNGFFGMINAVGGTFNIVAKQSGTIKFMDGQSSATNMEINGSGDIKFNNYGAGTLVTDASGNITAATSGAGTGSVTSVNVVTDGDALNVTSNTITGSGTMTLPWQGGSNQYVNGLGNLIDFPTIPQGTVEISGGPVAKEFAEWTNSDTIKGSSTLKVNSNGTGVNVFGNNTSGATGIFRLCKNDSISDPRFQFIIGSSLENYIYSGNGSNSHALKFGLLDANDNAIQNILTLKRGSGVQLPLLNEIGSDTDKFLMVSGTDNLIEYVTGANLLSYIGGTGSSGVTSIATTSPILGGTISSTGTISLLQPTSGAWFRGVSVIGSDGLMEVGRYIDFHNSNTGTSDFDVRLDCQTGNLLQLTGSFKTTSNLTINGLASFATSNTDAKVNIAQGTGSVGVNLLHASENSFRLSTKVGTNASSQTTPIFQQSLYYGLTENAGINYYRGGSTTGGRLAFSTNNGTERMFISSSGKIGLNEDSPTALLHVKALAATGTVFKLIGDPATTANQMLIYTTKAFNSSDTWYNMVCEAGNGSGGQTSTCIIERDGDLRNKNNSYGQISDSRLKENIQDATPKLDDVMKVKVKNFNFIGEDLKQIGVVAQELEEVFPGLVKEDKQPDLNGEEGGIYKSVKYSVLVPILLKAMQEQQEIIEDLKTRITKLEN